MFKITVNGKARRFETLEAATKVANEIFAATKVVVGIERQRERAERYADQAAEAERPCVYGHRGCAAVEGGPCSDEMLSKAEQAEAELWQKHLDQMKGET